VEDSGAEEAFDIFEYWLWLTLRVDTASFLFMRKVSN
jgi:hypothetical protein